MVGIHALNNQTTTRFYEDSSSVTPPGLVKICRLRRWNLFDIIFLVSGIVYSILSDYNLIRANSRERKDTVAEWLRRWIANPLLFERVSSNLTRVVPFEHNTIRHGAHLLVILNDYVRSIHTRTVNVLKIQI